MGNFKKWKTRPHCPPCTLKQCNKCTNVYQTKLWACKEDGELHDTCMDCRFDKIKCSKCNFKAPKVEWELKPDGTKYKLCPGCRDMFKPRATTSIGNCYSPNEYQTVRYNTDEEYRLKI